jgi:hypothetical protein
LKIFPSARRQSHKRITELFMHYVAYFFGGAFLSNAARGFGRFNGGNP